MESGIQVLRSISGIEGFRDDWMRMQWHPNSDIDFYQVALRSIPSVVRPHVLLLWRDGMPRAILAGRLENRRLTLKVGYSTIPGPKTRSLVFIYGGLLGDPSQEECKSLTEEIMSALRGGEADTVYFNHLRTDSVLYEALRKGPRFYSRDYCSSFQVHRFLALPDTLAGFRSHISPGVRNNLRWKANKFMRQYNGNVRIECLGKPSELDPMIRDVESVAALTYQRGLGAGFQDSEEERQRLQLKAERGWLRSFILYVEDKPCAFWVGTLYKRTFHSDHMGFDPTYRQHSPGTYLLIKMLEEFCSQGAARDIDAVDFGLGDAEYKRIVCNQEWIDASPCIFAPNIKGVVLNAYRTPLMHLDKMGHSLLNGHLQARLKRFWRDRVAGHASSGARSVAQDVQHKAKGD